MAFFTSAATNLSQRYSERPSIESKCNEVVTRGRWRAVPWNRDAIIHDLLRFGSGSTTHNFLLYQPVHLNGDLQRILNSTLNTRREMWGGVRGCRKHNTLNNMMTCTTMQFAGTRAVKYSTTSTPSGKFSSNVRKAMYLHPHCETMFLQQQHVTYNRASASAMARMRTTGLIVASTNCVAGVT